MMTQAADLPRILLVDDEPNVLDALRRQLRREFRVETAVGAAKGLFTLGQTEPFEVIVSDFLMPGINGAEFLAATRKASPHSTRMLLTGHTALADAAVTVNRGQVFRILLKPVDHETMTTALWDCVAQHRLVTSERELLEQTLRSSVKALMDVLSLASPTAFGRATRMRRTASAILDTVKTEDRWAIEMAVMMSQLGVVSLPPALSDKLDSGAELNATERTMVDHLPAVAEEIISPIPRLAPVCEAIRYSRKGFDGSGTPDDRIAGEEIPFGARLLRLVQDHDALVSEGVPAAMSLATLGSSPDLYDPVLFQALATAVAAGGAGTVRGVMLADLEPGMVLAVAVSNRMGVLLANADTEVTVSLISRLRNFATVEEGVREPLMVHASAPGPTSVDATAASATG
jgi:response regulator RpfG family c-di-GMP phosphodiesterase